MNPRPLSRLSGLDALRGAAALVVLWYHLNLSHRIGFYPPKGYLAVDFFFMLSGYVMARTYEGRMKSGSWFLKKRIRRLWPTVALGSLVGLAVFFRADVDFLVAATLNLFLIPVLWAGAVFPINTPIWSIFFELFANAVHGFWLHKVRTSYLCIMSAVAGLIGLAFAYRLGSYSMGSDSIDFVGGFPRVISAYFAGVILYRLWRDQPPVRAHPLLLLPVASLLFMPSDPLSDFLLVAFGCPLVMAVGLGAAPGKWASFIGQLSFPLYAVHRPVLALVALAGAGWLAGAGAAILASSLMLLPGFARTVRSVRQSRTPEGMAPPLA